MECSPSTSSFFKGSSAIFSVTATGTALTYQWRKGNVNLIDAGNISGATTATLTINPAAISDAALNYNVVVHGTYAPNDTSINVSLVVNSAPSIITQPSNQITCSGGSVSFSTSASGAGLTYQWRKGLMNLINTGNISGATSATLTINPVGVSDAAIDYNVVINGTCTPNVTSTNASLVINAAPIITTAPINQTVCIGSSVNFSVVATGTGLTYQWRKGIVNLINAGNISGVNTPTLTINPAGVFDAATDYNVVISGTCAPIVTSPNTSLVINTTPIVVVAPFNQTVCTGSSVNFSVTATGTGLTYQWRKGIVNLINAGNISGVNTPTLIINPVGISDAATDYNVVISGTCAPNVTSPNASLILNAAPIITTAPANQITCSGNSVSFSVSATGTGLTYQWRKGIVNLVNAGNISGVTTATLTINPVNSSDAATDYNVVISGTCAPNVLSPNAALAVNATPIITTAPSNQSLCEGNSVSFSVSATGTGLAYQWRKGTVNLTNNGHIFGVNTPTLTINPATISDAAIDYNVVVTGICSPNATSSNVSLSVNPIPVAVASSNSPICIDSSITLTAQTVVGATYLWTGPDGYSSSVQNAVIPTATTTDAGNYSLIITTNGCTSTPSTVSITINDCKGEIVFHIPEGFSPNGDLINDLFVIRGIENFPNNKFEIYNRWGNKVFDANSYTNTWDGKCTIGLRVGGDDLPIGTYFYILDLGDGTPVYKGTIYLNR